MDSSKVISKIVTNVFLLENGVYSSSRILGSTVRTLSRTKNDGRSLTCVFSVSIPLPYPVVGV